VNALVHGLPDYTRRTTIDLTVPTGRIFAPPVLQYGSISKPSYPLSTSWLKQYCIQMPYVTCASPSGKMVSYEGGYMLLALLTKAGSGEVVLAKNCLDEWVKLQKTDGSWSQQYEPYLNAAGSHDETLDLQVDSGAAMLAWAMSKYDKDQGTTTYKATVQKAFNFLRDCQYYFLVNQGVKLLCNQRLNGSWNYSSFAGDCGEVLLAAKACLDAYGADTLNEAGYSIKTFANDLYYAMVLCHWLGDAFRYFRTEYPFGVIPWGMEGYALKQKMPFVAAMASWSIYAWAKSPYLEASDYSEIATKALDFINTITVGRWGGYLYSPYYGEPGETKKEYPVYTAFMAMAMNAVDASRYSHMIDRCKALIQWLALPDGRVFDSVDEDGYLYVAEVLDPTADLIPGVAAPTIEAWQFLGHDVACGLLAGA